MAKLRKAFFHTVFTGYDDDPRELHEVPEVCAYAKQWARLTGMDDPIEADKWLRTCASRINPPFMGDELRGCGFSALVGLGVYGAELQAESLASSGMKPTPIPQ